MQFIIVFHVNIEVIISFTGARTIQIGEALQMQIDGQRQLNEQLEVRY
jgi:hypothetical protein